MASYDHRKAELRAQFDKWKTLMKPSEWDPISRAVEDYLKLRDEALTALVGVLADDGKDLKQSDFAGKLNDYCSRIGAGLGNMLSGMTDVSEGARLFREQAMVQEGTFFKSITDLDPCSTRDTLVTLEADFGKLSEDLVAKSGRTREDGHRIIDVELEATRAINQLFDDAINATAPVVDQIGMGLASLTTSVLGLGDKLNDWIVQWVKDYNERNPRPKIATEAETKKLFEAGKGVDEAADTAQQIGVPEDAIPSLAKDPGSFAIDFALAPLGDLLGQMVKVLITYRAGIAYKLRQPYAERVQQIKDKLPFHGTIIVTFGDTRKEVADFLAKNKIDTADKLKEQWDSNLSRWVEGQNVAGNHDDAVDLKIAMQAAVQSRFNRLSGALQKFVSDNSGIFLGTLDASTRKLLLDQEEWDRQMVGLEGKQLDERLRLWNDTVTTINPKLTDLWTAIQGQVATVPYLLQEPVMQAVKQAWDPLAAELRDAAQGAQVDDDQCIKTVGRDQRLSDLDRSDVTKKLPQ